MRKLILMILTIATGSITYALPLGNPHGAALFTNGAFCKSFGGCDVRDPCFSLWNAWSVRVGFYGDYVFNRHMEVQGSDHANIDFTRLYTNAGFLAFNVCDRVDIFTTLGVTNLSFENSMNAFPNTGATALLSSQNIEVFFNPHFSWSAGVRATLWQIGCFSLGLEGQYFRTNPEFNYVTVNGIKTYINNRSALYQEWQVGLGAAYAFEISCPEISMIPYLGFSWSDARLQMRNLQVALLPPAPTVTFLDLKAEKHWGFIVGTTLTLFEMVGVTVEGRFASEKAVYVLGEFRF